MLQELTLKRKTCLKDWVKESSQAGSGLRCAWPIHKLWPMNFMIQIQGRNYSNQESRGALEACKGLRRLIRTWLSISKTRTEFLVNRLKSKWHRRRRRRWQIQSLHPSRQRKSLRKRNMIVLCKYLDGLILTMMVRFLQNGSTSQKYQQICLKLWAHFSVRWMSCVIHLMLMNSSMLWEDSMTQFQCQRKAFYS